MIIGFIIDPIDPNFQHNTPRHIYFDRFRDIKKVKITLIIVKYSPKELLDSELPAYLMCLVLIWAHKIMLVAHCPTFFRAILNNNEGYILYFVFMLLIPQNIYGLEYWVEKWLDRCINKDNNHILFLVIQKKYIFPPPY